MKAESPTSIVTPPPAATTHSVSAEAPTSSGDAAAEPVTATEEYLAAMQVSDPEKSQFDYIVVGTGAGGGPMAARLARAGKKVLVIEAGRDPAKAGGSPPYPDAPHGEVTKVPGYYAAASEDQEMSWMFSVRHFADRATQEKDAKFNKNIDPNTGNAIPDKYLDRDLPRRQQGVFYPRSSGIGGCTAHHAMITIRPNDKDWDYIANLTGDDSWRAGAMRGYFAKFERNQYIDAYNQFLSKFLGIFYRLWRWFWLLLDPRAVLDEGGHGRKGWAPTNLLDPFLVFGIAKKDKAFIKVIIRAALGVLHGNFPAIAWIKSQLVRARVVPAIDFNDVNTRRTNPEGVFLIPLGIEGQREPDEEGKSAKGRRFGVRELLLTTRQKYPENLVILTELHVTRVLFDHTDTVPRAIGIESAVGDHLYEASPAQKSDSGKRRMFFVKAQGGEVILSGGAFNTPQLLMLSGIGDVAHLEEIAKLEGDPECCVLHDRNGQPLLTMKSKPVRIHLLGVGRNLQDRYEVTVVSELDKEFETLESVSFEPGDPDDRARSKWLKDRDGLYATNGGTLAVIRRSKAAVEAGHAESDLFTFGAPAAFRGYYWNWSRELFKPTLGAAEDKRRIWSWVILKAYTRNHDGTVRLRSADPFAMPEICFDSFNEQAEKEYAELAIKWRDVTNDCDKYERLGEPLPEDLRRDRERLIVEREENARKLVESKRDLAALVDAVAFMRKVNARNPEQFVREIQPGPEIPDYTSEIEEWVRTQAWGHHCSCTCRIGSDKWQANPADLQDKEAVIDSRFKVHGVKGLRIVDASIFPKIPGYFILAPIFMISEKAADTLIEDAATAVVYPVPFQRAEAKAVRERRRKAHLGVENAEAGHPDAGGDHPPGNTIGLALSGGGIRSATFALGVLQALAEKGRLREIDFLSTVSGGGFIGSFLGRLFTRDAVKESKDPAGRVQDVVKNSSSAPLWWLRTNANYIFATGLDDLRQNLAVFWRNIFTLHLVIGTLFFTIFGLLAWLPGAGGKWLDGLGWFRIHGMLAPLLAPPTLCGLTLSFWWWLPVAVLGLVIVPATLGYWLAPKTGSYRPYPIFSLLAWLFLLIGAGAGLLVPGGGLYAGGLLLLLLLSWFWQEAARWGALPRGASEAEERQQTGVIVHNRLTRALGEAVTIFAALVVWVVLDTLAVLFAQEGSGGALTALMLALAPLLPLLRWTGTHALQKLTMDDKKGFSIVKTATLLGIPLALFLLWVVDVFAHKLFLSYPAAGIAVVAVTGVFSLAVGRAIDFLNLSSLGATYATRLARTFQGASNEERVYGSTETLSHDVQTAHPKDDLPHDQYHPENQGGPLHLINVCVNETVDAASDRQVPERKGLPMCITPHGVSVGQRYFATWAVADRRPFWQKLRRWRDGLDAEDKKDMRDRRLTALKAVPLANDPNAFHVLKSTGSDSAEVEPLSLATWIAVSGAAFTTGIGRGTNVALALFMGLANVRLGYWWDSGIRPGERPGRYPQPLWRKIKGLPSWVFRIQSMLLAEWRARFRGPSQWFWYLSDGGHFEVTGLYELIRRRVKFMIVSEAGEDPNYEWGDVALLTQQVREDFGAEIKWLDFTEARAALDEELNQATQHEEKAPEDETDKHAKAQQRLQRWRGILGKCSGERIEIDEWIRQWIDPDKLGPLKDIRREGDGERKNYHAALARVSYSGSKDVSWILLFKPSLSTDLTEDIVNYGKVNSKFPHTPTFDQVFDDIQWESYRALGQQIARNVISAAD